MFAGSLALYLFKVSLIDFALEVERLWVWRMLGVGGERWWQRSRCFDDFWCVEFGLVQGVCSFSGGVCSVSGSFVQTWTPCRCSMEVLRVAGVLWHHGEGAGAGGPLSGTFGVTVSVVVWCCWALDFLFHDGHVPIWWSKSRMYWFSLVVFGFTLDVKVSGFSGLSESAYSWVYWRRCGESVFFLEVCLGVCLLVRGLVSCFLLGVCLGETILLLEVN
ncbi:unnamed protein product [Amaranthus hypochondriacus]